MVFRKNNKFDFTSFQIVNLLRVTCEIFWLMKICNLIFRHVRILKIFVNYRIIITLVFYIARNYLPCSKKWIMQNSWKVIYHGSNKELVQSIYTSSDKLRTVTIWLIIIKYLFWYFFYRWTIGITWCKLGNKFIWSRFITGLQINLYLEQPIENSIVCNIFPA
jgi:hypothetical protein